MDSYKTPVISLLDIVWQNNRTAGWQRLNQALYQVLDSAIFANFEFDEDDFFEIDKRFRSGYWFGCNSNGNGYGERLYMTACEVRNTSACLAYEKWTAIVPFIKDNVRCSVRTYLFDRENRYRVTGWSEDGKNKHSFLCFE